MPHGGVTQDPRNQHGQAGDSKSLPPVEPLVEQKDRGAQNAGAAANHQSDCHQVRYRVGYLQLHSRPHAGLKHMGLGPKNA